MDDTNTLNVHIHALRQKLTKYTNSNAPAIKTVWGLGYKMENQKVENEIKNYILVGYLVSTILTILVVFWAVQRMLIDKSEVYFLVGMTLIASFIGAAVSIFLLSPVFPL